MDYINFSIIREDVMAIEKDETLATGVSANYWKIDNMQIDKNGRAKVYLGLYLNKSASDDGKQPLTTELYELPGFTVSELKKADPFALAYTKISEKAQFTDAKEV